MNHAPDVIALLAELNRLRAAIETAYADLGTPSLDVGFVHARPTRAALEQRIVMCRAGLRDALDGREREWYAEYRRKIETDRIAS